MLAIKFDKVLWCKHLIASKLALAIDNFETSLVTECEFQNILNVNILNI